MYTIVLSNLAFEVIVITMRKRESYNGANKRNWRTHTIPLFRWHVFILTRAPDSIKNLFYAQLICTVKGQDKKNQSKFQ